MQPEVFKLLKDKWESGDFGWYSNSQIRLMLLKNGYNIGGDLVTIATKKLTRSGFIDREYIKGMGVFRFKCINKKFKSLACNDL